MTIDPAESVFRLLLVFALAFGIGLERQIRRKPVGFGTFIFVSTGAAALSILAIDLEGDNPLPLLGGVITDIGFLGAGALIRANDLDAILPSAFSRFERVHVDKEAHQVSVTAQVRLKPDAVAGLLEALRRNEKVRKFEIE